MRIVLTSACLAFACLAAPAAEAGLAGRYAATGTNLDGSPYRGMVEIVLTSRDTCRISWDDGATATGICMRNRNAFAAGYTMDGEVGLVIYEIQPDGTLDGLWTISGQDGSGTERLTPLD